MSSTELVCPRCGTPPGLDQRFCGHCGLDLRSQYQLPTRQEWAARQYASASAGAWEEPAAPADEATHQVGTTEDTQHFGAAGGTHQLGATEDTARFGAAGAQRTFPSGGARIPVGAASWAGLARRDALLAGAGVTLAVGLFLATIGSLLTLIDNIHTYVPAGVGVGHGFQFVDGALSTAALAVFGMAFYLADVRRYSRLAIAALLLALAFAANFVAQVTLAVEYLTHHASGTLSAATIVAALTAVPVAVAALFARATFTGYRPADPGDLAGRDGRLGAAAAVGAGGTLLLAISTILDTVYFSDAGAPGGFTTGLGMQAAATFVLTAAVLTGAVAFWAATRLSLPPSSHIARRDGLLSLAAMVGAFAYLFLFIGWVLATSSGADVIFDGKEVAAGWLSAVQSFAWCGGLLAAAVGFFLGRRVVGAPTG
jgi:hypothetical protein